MEKEEITQERIPVGACEIISGRGDEEDLRSLPVDRYLHLDACDLFNLIHRKIDR